MHSDEPIPERPRAAEGSPLPSYDDEGDNAVGLIKALGFIAWSDDRIAPEEKEILRHAMDALGIPEERRKSLCASICAGPPALDDIHASFTDDLERRFAFAQAILLAQADGPIVASEQRDLAALARALDIADDELQMIQAAVDLTGDLVGRHEQPGQAGEESCGA